MTELSEAEPASPKTRSDAEGKPIERLTRRRQFLAAAKGKRCHTSAFTLQSVPSASAEPKRGSPSTSVEETDISCGVLVAAPGQGHCTAPRFGITVTKKIGGAVTRNRIRRRLREALRGLVPLPARPGYDYVIVARREALGMPFALLQEGLSKSLLRIDRASAKSGIVQSGAEPLPRGRQAAPAPSRSRPHKNRTGKAPKA